MSKTRVLYVCHNHPSVRPGGAEAYALELYEAMRATDEFEPILLAKGGPPNSTRRPHDRAMVGPVNGDPNQYFLYTEGYGFDSFSGAVTDKTFYTRHFREVLRALRPDVVHFQHTWFLGYELIREVKNTLPDAPILYTLHEYLPICHRNGQMVRRDDGAVCHDASPTRCHGCFPEITPEAFYLRRRFVQAQFDLVDLFLAPSEFLRQRYIEWGIPSERIRFEEYGRLGFARRAAADERSTRNRFGYFGQFTTYKGVDVLLQAIKRLSGSLPLAHVWLHGANLDLQPGSYQNEIRSLLDQTSDHVTFVGQYGRSDLPRLMDGIDWVVVPSIWWENSPLVIQEAFFHGRPVLCSDIGGMAEKVSHDKNGLHFCAGDPASLAAAIRHAATTPGLWERLRQGIPEMYAMDRHVETLTEIYQRMCAERSNVAVQV